MTHVCCGSGCVVGRPGPVLLGHTAATRHLPQSRLQHQRQRRPRCLPASAGADGMTTGGGGGGGGGGGSAAPASAAASTAFDTATYDAERLALDAVAMEEMRQKSAAAAAEEEAAEVAPPGAWKWAIRKQIWDLLEERNLADFPRPVHHRIPNFKGAAEAAATLAALPEFQAAQCVKINPDTPQKQVRFAALASGKTLLSPQPRLRTGFFSALHRDSIPPEALLEACTSAGVVKYGKPLSLDAKLKVDLIVVGSVAVDPETGCRLGKGEGFAELEWGLLAYMKAVDDSTLVVTTVRDEQLLPGGSIPAGKMLPHDVPVDIICTPTQVIRVAQPGIRKPAGILWERLSPQKLSKIRVLQQLKQRIEEEQGNRLPTGPDEVLPPVAAKGRRRPSQGGGGSKGDKDGCSRRQRRQGRGSGGGPQ